MGTVWRAKFLKNTKLTVRAKMFDVDERGILVPQPDGDIAAYLRTHPSFEQAKQKGASPASALPAKPAPVASPASTAPDSEKKSESDPPDPASMSWPELRSYAAGLGIKAKSKKDILEALAERS